MTSNKRRLIRTLSLTAPLILAACASSPDTQNDAAPIPNPIHGNTLTAVPRTQLPAAQQWQCRDGNILQTHLQGEHLQLTYQGRQYQLQRTPTAQPAIYQSTELLFSSDGHSAVVGQPYSNRIYSSGCLPR